MQMPKWLQFRKENEQLRAAVKAQAKAIETYKEACVIHESTNLMYSVMIDNVRNSLSDIIPDSDSYSVVQLADMTATYVLALEERLKHV